MGKFYISLINPPSVFIGSSWKLADPINLLNPHIIQRTLRPQGPMLLNIFIQWKWCIALNLHMTVCYIVMFMLYLNFIYFLFICLATTWIAARHSMCYCCVLQYLHLDTKNQCSILEHGGGTVLTSPVACSTKMWHNINY